MNDETDVIEADSPDIESNGEDDAPSIEDQARGLGWKSEDEWRGDPPPQGFLDADKFLEQHHIVARVNDGLQGKLDRLQAQYDALETRTKVQTDWQDKIAQQEYDKALTAIRAEQQDAIDESDGAAFAKAKAKEDALEVPEPTPEPKASAPSPSAAFEAWSGDNDWYGQDARLSKYADFVAQDIRGNAPNMSEAAFYEEVTKQVKEQFPDSFGGKPRKRAPSPEGGGQRLRNGNGKSWRDIPADERKEIENNFFGEGNMYERTDKDRARYAEAYWAQE